MIISNVNIGSGPGLNDGESIYSAFYKVNQNFANVQSNVNSLTNSVSSVAGRTGNVTLTINDIVGLNSSYAINGNVTAANVGMKGYVDAKIAANVAALIDSAPGVLDTLNELAAAINDDASFATTIVNTINSTNSNVTIANTNMKGYVDGQVSAVNSAITLANTIQSNQISSANLGMKGYVDSLTYSNVQVATYLPTYTGNIKAQYANLIGEAGTGLNSIRGGIPGIETFGNTIAQFHTNINSPAHVAVHNRSTGSAATSGFMATADIGDENNFRTLVGIFGSGYTPLSWAKPLDSVLLGMGGNLVIGANSGANIANPIKDINFVLANGSVLIPLKISAEPGMAQANVELGTNTGLKFSDGTRQTSAYSNVQTATYTNLSTYAYNANVTAANIGMKGYVDSVASQSIYGNANVAAYTESMGFTNFSNVNVSAVITTNGLTNYSNVNTKAYTESMGFQNYGNVNVAAVITTNGLTNYSNVNTAAYLASQSITSYSNVQVATYLPTYTGNIANVRLGTSGVLTFADTTTQTTAWTGTVAGGSVTGNVAESSLAYAVNISSVLLNQEYPMAMLPSTTGAYGVKSSDGTVGFTFNPARNRMTVGNIELGADGNIKFADGTIQTTAATYSNVQVATYLPTYTGALTPSSISAGNVSVPGTSGKIGFSSGGFAQQATSNSTQVTSHFTSGNIQLMSIDLGAHAVHTVTFACNKLTTSDLLLVKHVSGGLTSVYVDAYVASDGLAVIWLRDITGVGTGAFIPMLKYAIIRAPSS